MARLTLPRRSRSRRGPLAIALASLLLIVTGCGGSAGSSAGSSGAAQPGVPDASTAAPAQGVDAATITPVVTFPASPVPGNSVMAAMPTDAPAVVRGLAPLPSCGSELNFEADPDISPLPTAPWPTSDVSANLQGAQCLIWAWENGKPAQYAVSSISDEQDEIYTLYRLPGDGTVDVLTRVKSKPDQAVTWSDATCKQLSIQESQVTPAECSAETPLN